MASWSSRLDNLFGCKSVLKPELQHTKYYLVLENLLKVASRIDSWGSPCRTRRENILKARRSSCTNFNLWRTMSRGFIDVIRQVSAIAKFCSLVKHFHDQVNCPSAFAWPDGYNLQNTRIGCLLIIS